MECFCLLFMVRRIPNSASTIIWVCASKFGHCMETKKKKSQNLFLPFKFSSQLEIKRLFKNKCPADRWKVSSELFLSENQKFQRHKPQQPYAKLDWNSEVDAMAELWIKTSMAVHWSKMIHVLSNKGARLKLNLALTSFKICKLIS